MVSSKLYGLSLLAAVAFAAPRAAVISQISDGQPQAPTQPMMPVSQIGDGQPQAPVPSMKPVSQISDGQPQAPVPTMRPVSQISDGQPQAPVPTIKPISQIGDGQPQAPVQTAAPVSQIGDGQPQAPVMSAVPVSQIGDGQPQAPVMSAVPVSQIGDGQPQAPAKSAGSPMAAPTYAGMSSAAAAAGTGLATVFGPDSQIPYSNVPSLSAPPIVSSQVTGATSHGAFKGTATTTGAPQSGPAKTYATPLPPNPTATYYNKEGKLTQEEPLPYTPAGGLGTNGTLPRYQVNSDFDYFSIALGLYQEWIELDLFHNGLAIFSPEDFLDAGLTAEDRSYIEFMADQESGHATLLTNMLGASAPPQCTYDYPYRNVREFVDFNQKLTTWGEAGVWGFINHLDAREVAQLLSQSIATEARQEMSFRQMSGLAPQPFWFASGIPQSWAWTYLAQYISSCPEGTTRLPWQNFPQLTIVNQPNINRFSPNDTKNYEVAGRRIADPSDATIPEIESCINLNVTGYGCGPAIARNRSEPLNFPGKKLLLEWETPGKAVGPNNSYVTSTIVKEPKYVAFVAQLNMTYTDLHITGTNQGYTYLPDAEVYEGDPMVNGTMFVALTDTNAPFTAFNLSSINPHVAALGLFQAG